MASNDPILRAQLSHLLERSQAHIGFDKAVDGVAPEVRGVRPAGLPHSLWELLEHIRRAQRDILDFCLEAPYTAQEWPAGYWPTSPEPPSPSAWDECVAAIRADRAELQRLIEDPAIDLAAKVPHATRDDQTYLREVLVSADHNAYHLGQFMTVRQLLEA